MPQKGPPNPDLPTARSGRQALAVAQEAAAVAQGLILKGLAGGKGVRSKGRGNVVTDVDLACERAIVELLQGEFPSHGLLCEEEHRREGEFTWIVDPIDGTRNYASGVPHCSTSIALAHGADIVLGLVHDPLRGETFHALKGQGAFLNGRRLSVSSVEGLAAALVGVDLGYKDARGAQALAIVAALWPVEGVRVMGSSVLGQAYVAAGRLDLYFHHSLYPWDLAAGILLVREAGGIATDRDGQEAAPARESLVVANPALHRRFMERVGRMPWRG
ncbi:MAG: inositol monophosphatase [Dehalococcoidia bacterium]|nr:inositol monophosphatase [Dehalococcoidia bacterium]